jgi:hypothetical protein
MSPEKSTIASLQDKGWTLVNDQQRPLGNLQGKAIDSYELVCHTFGYMTCAIFMLLCY